MKNLIIVALLALSGLLVWKLVKKPAVVVKQSTGINKASKDLVNIEVENINKKVDRSGFEHAWMEDKQQLIRDYNELDSNSRKAIDSLNKQLGIKDKQLSSYTSVIAVIRDSLMKATNIGDTLYTFRDRYANITFNRPDETFSFRYDARIETAEYWKRKWFLAPKKNYIDIWMADKRATINGVQRLRVEPRPDMFDLNLKATGQYHLGELGLGGKVNVRFGRITGSGAYLYYPNLDAWHKAFSIDYEIGGF